MTENDASYAAGLLYIKLERLAQWHDAYENARDKGLWATATALDHAIGILRKEIEVAGQEYLDRFCGKKVK